MHTKSLEKYTTAVNSLASIRSKFTAICTGDKEAAIVNSSIIGISNTLKIYSKDFDSAVEHQQIYRDSLRNFILTGGAVQLVLDEYPSIERFAYSDLLNYREKGWNISISIANDLFKREIESAYANFLKKSPIKIIDKRDPNNRCYFSLGIGLTSSFFIRLSYARKIGVFCMNDESGFFTRSLSYKMKRTFDKYYENLPQLK